MPLTLSPPAPPAVWPVLDEDQRRVVEHRGPALLVLGPAGSGRTTTALATVVDRIASGELAPQDVLLLAPTRRAAARLRDALSSRLDRTTSVPIVRTPAAVAFSVLRARDALRGDPAPTLISGPEQDLVLAELLAGHAESEGVDVRWPARVPTQALGLRAFRDELRDLLMRAAERGLLPADLEELGVRHARPEWTAAAQLYAEYLDVTRLRAATPDAGARYDAAVVVDEAADALETWEIDLPGAARPRWRLVVVDDYQESTAATVRLLHVLAADATDLVLLADPDLAVQTFRGAQPGLVAEATVPVVTGGLGAFGAQQVFLGRVWRHGPELRRVTRQVTEAIHGTVRRQRPVGPATEAAGDVAVRLLRSPAQEAAAIAYLLRAARLERGLPWSEMAVVVRSGAQISQLRRALLAAAVPVAVLGSDVPLRAEPAVRPLLLAFDAVLGPDGLTADRAAELITSPLGGLDAVGLRRLRRALRAHEIAGGGVRTSDPLLVAALAGSEQAATLPSTVRRPVQRIARVLAAGRDATAMPGATALDVLWAMWSSTGLTEDWRRAALSGGSAGARADRDLDAVLAVFAAAERFVDRMPQASPSAFLEHLQSQDLPADTLAAHGDLAESVALLTAAGAAGGQWDLVVVAGVQEGVWPDLRLRDSLLGAQDLVDVLTGRGARSDGADGFAAARAAVLDDELRAFAVAVSRARRCLMVTAVSDADNQPSPLLDLVEPRPESVDPLRQYTVLPDDLRLRTVTGDDDARRIAVPPALDLRAVVAGCRVELERAPDADAQHPAAVLLARLAAEHVPGALPDQWYGAPGLSTTEPLWQQDGLVPLSPSRIESADTCALRWALEAAGGTAASSGEQSLGTLVHSIAAELPTGSLAELTAALDRRWGELGLTAGWTGAVQRRRADRIMAHLAEYLARADEVAGVEVGFTAQIGRTVLRGSIDRLERVTGADGRPDRLRVVDLKTGRTPTPAAKAATNAQLGAYQLAVESGALDDLLAEGPVAPDVERSAGASLVFVGTGNQHVARRDQTALAAAAEPRWAADLLDRVVTTVCGSAMAATENDLCAMCPVRRSCPVQVEGRVVGR